MSEYICPECGQPCSTKECDSGIGPHEFWGQTFNDVCLYTGSDCCEAALDGIELDDGSDYGDYLYEQEKDRRMEELDSFDQH